MANYSSEDLVSLEIEQILQRKNQLQNETELLNARLQQLYTISNRINITAALSEFASAFQNPSAKSKKKWKKNKVNVHILCFVDFFIHFFGACSTTGAAKLSRIIGFPIFIVTIVCFIHLSSFHLSLYRKRVTIYCVQKLWK